MKGFFLIFSGAPFATSSLLNPICRRPVRDSMIFSRPSNAPPHTNRMSFDGLEKRSEEHTSELQSRPHLVCRLLLEKKNPTNPGPRTGKATSDTGGRWGS